VTNQNGDGAPDHDAALARTRERVRRRIRRDRLLAVVFLIGLVLILLIGLAWFGTDVAAVVVVVAAAIREEFPWSLALVFVILIAGIWWYVFRPTWHA